MSTRSRLARFGRFAVGAILVALVAEGLARAVLTQTPDAVRWYDATAQLKIEQMDAIGDVDVVFVGTSMAWQAFVTSEFEAETGLRAYNAGLNGGTPEVMERWLLEEVLHRTSPATVVWGVGALDFAPHYGADQRVAYDDALATRGGWLADVENVVADHSALVANRSVLRDLDAVTGSAADDRELLFDAAAAVLGPRGERLDFRTDRSEEHRDIMRARLREYHPSADDIDRIIGVASALEAHGIELVVVHLPTSASMVAAMPSPLTAHLQTMAATDVVAQAAGARLIETSLGWADDRFVDFAHLDEATAIDFTAQFAAAFLSERDDRGTAPVALGDAPAPAADERCVPETVIDDYGFEVEIVTCPGAPSGASLVPDDTGPVAVAVAARDAACANGEAPTTALLEIAAAIDAESNRIADAAGYEILASHDDVLARVGAPIDCPGATVADATATAEVVAALDRMYQLQDIPELRASGVWGHADRLETALWVRDTIERGVEVDRLVVGNSVARSALDPRWLGDFAGGTWGQASIGGTSPETQGVWFDEVVPLLDPDEIYWGISFYDLYALCTVDRRAAAAAADATRRQEAFTGIVDPAQRARWDHLIGPLGQTTYGDTALLEEIDLPDAVATRGGGATWTEPRPDLLQKHRDDVGVITFPDTPCTDRFDPIASTVAALEADGRRVVMFAIPPNPAFVDDLPGGMNQFAADASEMLEASGADDWIVFDDPMDPSLYLDGIHFIDEGRAAFTARFAAAVTPPG